LALLALTLIWMAARSNTFEDSFDLRCHQERKRVLININAAKVRAQLAAWSEQTNT